MHSLLFTALILLGYDNFQFVWPWNNTPDGIGESLGAFA